MTFLKRQVPLLICLIVGIATIFQYYVPHPISNSYLESLSKAVLIIGGFALLLGVISLFIPHMGRIRRKADGWGYSVIMFVGFLIGLVPGLISMASQVNPDGSMTSFGWMYTFFLSPLQSTMFAMIAFFIVSCSFRAFRIKTAEAFVLFLSAFILLAGRVPIGQMVFDKLFAFANVTISQVVEWIMSVPVVSARRGIMIGIALGAIAMSIKIIVGIERQYLGGKD